VHAAPALEASVRRARLEPMAETMRASDAPARQVAHTLYALANSCAALGDTTRAAALRREAHDRLARPSGTWRISDILRTEAMNRLRDDDIAGAELHCRQALALELEAFGDREDGAVERAALLPELRASLLAASGADHPLVRGHRQLLRCTGTSQWQLGADIQDAARVMERAGDTMAARTLLELALGVTCQEFGDDCPVRLTSMRILARICRADGDLETARRHLENAVAIVSRTGRTHTPRGIEIALDLTEACLDLHDRAGAASARRVIDRTAGAAAESDAALARRLREVDARLEFAR
jgi:hypothetical protein